MSEDKKIIRVVATILEKDNGILIARRNYGDFAGLWEFPGGKYEEGETGEQAIKREIKEEFDVDIAVKEYLCTVEHDYEKFHLIMDCYICVLLNNDLHLHDHSAIKWVSSDDLNVDWLPADRKVINAYRNRNKC